jgi:hypothetical protein
MVIVVGGILHQCGFGISRDEAASDDGQEEEHEHQSLVFHGLLKGVVRLNSQQVWIKGKMGWMELIATTTTKTTYNKKPSENSYECFFTIITIVAAVGGVYS